MARRSFFSSLGALAVDFVADTAGALRQRMAKAAGDEDTDDEDDDEGDDGDGPPPSWNINDDPDAANQMPEQPGKAKGNNAPGDEDRGNPISPLVAKMGEPTYEEKPATTRELARARRKEERAAMDPQSLLFDPMAIVNALGFKDKPSPMTYATLRATSFRTPIVSAMIKSRITQVSNFATPAEDKYSLGFRVRLRDRKQKATPVSEKESKRLTQWLLRTGNVSDEEAVNRDNFETFLKKITRDTLTYDQLCFEIQPARNGKPFGMYAVDAATMRIADSVKLHIPDEDLTTARFVQVYEGLTINTYTAQELCFAVRNPSTTIGMQGYGISEIEMLIQTITALLWGMDYNMKFFSQGASAKGILNIKGNIPEKALKAFRQHWYSMVAGIENAFKTPILNAEDAQWLDMHSSNKDMEYNAWMDFLIKIVAAIYDMDPMEINFKYGDSGGKSMFESSNQQKLSASKDKGLKPLLRFLQTRINSHIVYRLNEDFELDFVGLDAQTIQEAADLTEKLTKSIMTIDEARAQEDLAPLPNGAGAIIRDPTWLQHIQAATAPEPGAGGDASGLDSDPFGGGDDDGGGGDDGAGQSDDDKPGADGGAPPPKDNPFAKGRTRAILQPRALLPPSPLAKAAPVRDNVVVIDVEV